MNQDNRVQGVWESGNSAEVAVAEGYTVGELHSEASSSEYDVVPRTDRYGNLVLDGSDKEVKGFVEDVLGDQGSVLDSEVAADGGRKRPDPARSDPRYDVETREPYTGAD